MRPLDAPLCTRDCPPMGWFKEALAAEFRAAVRYCYGLQYVGIFSLFLFAIVILGSQTYAFLRTGQWNTLSLDRLFHNAGLYEYVHLESWPGLTFILQSIPTSATFLLIGAIWLGVLRRRVGPRFDEKGWPVR
jgi:hypothetical protein